MKGVDWGRKCAIGLAALGAVGVILAVTGCAGGNERYLARPAGFWAGLWHGVICVITFVIGLFTDSVRMYEVHNSGNWYNFGFLLGAMISLGGNAAARCRGRRKRRDVDWDETCRRVEEKVRRGIRNWVDESEGDDSEWAEIGRKVEEKIKRELRDWADR